MSNNSFLIKHTKSFLRVTEEIPEIRYAGNEILQNPTQAVTCEEGVQIATALKATLSSYRAITGYGRGLAAPQIGLSKSVFVTYVDDSFQTFINPTITASTSVRNRYRELCISSGMVSAEVVRAAEITMKWADEDDRKQQKSFEGMLARLYQHEVDHLCGIVNIDIAEPKSLRIVQTDPFAETIRPV